MKSNKKALMLIELSVLTICSMIFFIAVSNMINTRASLLKRIVENNNVIMILESLSDKIKYDIKSGTKIDELNLSEYEEFFSDDYFKLRLRKDNNKIDILLAVYYKSSFGALTIPTIRRIYKKEVLLDE